MKATDTATTADARLDVRSEAGSTTSGDARMYVYSAQQDVSAEFKTSGDDNIGTLKLHSEGTQGAVMTVLTTNTAASSDARLDVRADPQGSTSTSGNAHLDVFSESQDVDVLIKTDGQAGMYAHAAVVSDGEYGTQVTLASTNAATTSVSKLHIYADASSSTSGNAEVYAYSSKQNESVNGLVHGKSPPA